MLVLANEIRLVITEVKHSYGWTGRRNAVRELHACVEFIRFTARTSGVQPFDI
jgi:hypothetical protein